MNKQELKESIENLKREIEELEFLTNVGNTEGFDSIIAKIKEEMIANVKEEDWKNFKQNKSKIEKMRSFTDYIEKQTQIIEDKQKELKDLEYQYNNYQPSLFESEEQKQATGFFTGEEPNEETELYTGDIFKTEIDSGDETKSETGYVIITRSSQKPENFAIVSTFFDDEKLLQYPANRSILDECDYVGNLYEDSDNEEIKNLIENFSVSTDEDKEE